MIQGICIMKKNFIICLLILTVLFTSCSGKSRSVEDCSADVISLMSEMLKDENYAKSYNLSQSCNDTVEEMKAADYSDPIAIYELSVSAKDLLSSCDISTDNMKTDLKDYLTSSAYTSFASFINRKAGVDAITISAVYNAQQSFVCNDITENKLLLYVYEGGNPIIVSVLPGDSGAVRITGNFIINESFLTDSEENIEKSCEKCDIFGVTATKQ